MTAASDAVAGHPDGSHPGEVHPGEVHLGDAHPGAAVAAKQPAPERHPSTVEAVRQEEPGWEGDLQEHRASAVATFRGRKTHLQSHIEG
jgi:hypothetical protein